MADEPANDNDRQRENGVNREMQRAAVADRKRGDISARTIAALQAARARGTKLGNPSWQTSLPRARAARNPVALEDQVTDFIQSRREDGRTLRDIAGHLNGLGLATPRGKQWYASTVRTVLNRISLERQ